MAASKQKQVYYFYDEEMTNYNYGGLNPMRPHRVKLATHLVQGYGLTNKMQLLRPVAKHREDILLFHSDDYVDFLSSVTPENQEDFMMQMRRFNLGPVGEADCPVFDGMFDYFRQYTGGSVGGASLINQGEADLVMNWSGGMHHAKKGEASGFCYINDIVLAILELLREHARVLYVDIDIHHGDGVEEAFYTTDRVMTVSFHKYGDFFPGTGALGDVGFGAGKHYAVNVPLGDGMDDESYKYVFEPVMTKVMEMYQPGAIVICAGADSLSGDKLGCFNLSLQGHSACIEFLARFGVPMLVVGGGGYTLRNVARCWCYETGRLLGEDLEDELPPAALQQYNYYMDTGRLRIDVSNMRNSNSRETLDRIRTTVLEALSQLPPAPSPQIAAKPPSIAIKPPKDEIEYDWDARGGGAAAEDARVVRDDDAASDDELDGGMEGRVRDLDLRLQPELGVEAPVPMDEGVARVKSEPDDRAASPPAAAAASSPVAARPVEVELAPQPPPIPEEAARAGAVAVAPAPPSPPASAPPPPAAEPAASSPMQVEVAEGVAEAAAKGSPPPPPPAPVALQPASPGAGPAGPAPAQEAALPSPPSVAPPAPEAAPGQALEASAAPAAPPPPPPPPLAEVAPAAPEQP